MKELTYSVRELQARLGEALRAARRGERVRIVARGAPDIVLTREARPQGLPESAVQRKLKRLAAQGRIIPGKPGRIKPFKPFRLGGVSAQLLADRR
jgi:antitoxin (DNA-binding transcriptional repressor) of toxin-antitoxin stability system